MYALELGGIRVDFDLGALTYGRCYDINIIAAHSRWSQYSFKMMTIRLYQIICQFGHFMNSSHSVSAEWIYTLNMKFTKNSKTTLGIDVLFLAVVARYYCTCSELNSTFKTIFYLSCFLHRDFVLSCTLIFLFKCCYYFCKIKHA